MDPAETLKTLIKQELDKKLPAFGLINTYLKALREAVSRERLTLGEADEDCCSEEMSMKSSDYTITGGGVHLATTRNEVLQDNALAAMSQMAAKSGYDPMAAILQALPTINTLYDGEEREAVHGLLKLEVDKRLHQAQPEAASQITVKPTEEATP
jgi:hypothetical protein